MPIPWWRRLIYPPWDSTHSQRRVTVRMGKRTKLLAPTLEPDSWVVIDHPDLDSVAARSLVLAKPKTVVNCSPFVTGKYPNQGPVLLLEADIRLFEASSSLFDVLADGESLAEESGVWLRSDGTPVPGLLPVGGDQIARRLEEARKNLDGEITRFARNTIEFLERPDERSLLLEAPDLPYIRAAIEGKHVLIAVRGPGLEKDLARLLSYIQDRKPVIIAVDGAADALAELGLGVDVLIGDMDSVSDRGLRAAKEIVVHAYVPRNGDKVRAPGAERVKGLGLDFQLFPIPGTSEDAAMILAHEKGADLIVAVGSHSNLEDFLDKGRGGMASTFLVRLKVGSRLVDARGVSRLHGDSRRATAWMLGLFISAAFPVVVLVAGTPFGSMVARAAKVWWRTMIP